jgi:glutamyl-tRNA(Gln) amidotransferase subunit D
MKNKVNPGDKVKIITSKEEIKGVFLNCSDSSLILIKLKSGYNILIKKEDVLEIQKLKQKEKKEKQTKTVKQNKNLPEIDIIITGGTISSKIDYESGGVKWITQPEELFEFYPELFEIAKIRKIKIPFIKGSENINSKDWKILSKEIQESLNNKNVKGIIITHGTDFLHYTASALSFFIKDLNKPIVLTYSQRSSDRASSDASLNLICSTHAALSEIAEVMIVGHATSSDDFCYALPGTKSKKMHSTKRNAFQPINSKPIAKIFPNGKIENLSSYKKRDETNKPKLDSVFEDNIALIKLYPNQSPDIIDYYSQRYRGIIIEGSGLGHVLTQESTNNWIPKIKKAINNGLIICMTSQTIFGKVNSKVYSPARELEKAGVIYLNDMLSETAFVKLGYVLAKTKNPEKIKKLLLKNISREINSRRTN